MMNTKVKRLKRIVKLSIINDRIDESSSDSLSIVPHFAMSSGRAQARPNAATTWGLPSTLSVTADGLPSAPSMSGL